MSVTEQELRTGPQKPITVTVYAQEVGELTARRTQPYEYLQYILAKLRAAGGPVEGTLHLRITHGALLRVKQSAAGPGQFDFIWLPEAWMERINQLGGLHSAASPGGIRLHVN